MTKRTTMVGAVDEEALAFTAGKDLVLDLELVEPDCIGSAAHAAMLARLPAGQRPFDRAGRDRIVAELIEIMRAARKGKLKIGKTDQDIHLAVERMLTRKLGELGARIHTCRSRNDQVALDIRLYARERLNRLMLRMTDLAAVLLRFARKHGSVPMVGRTHMQPAMPASVGLWASAYAESMLDDLVLARAVYDVNNRSPLGSGAGYGVPFDIDRDLVARLLGMSRPVHNVLHASNTRGKCEAAILSALAQVMITLSRLASDLILYSMPEFGYFRIPPEFCTGSSMMPQKRNPDVLELIRARAALVAAQAFTVQEIVRPLPGGYSRDLQETKGPLIEGIHTAEQCLSVTGSIMKRLAVDRKALTAGFRPEVFATDMALDLVERGMDFRSAYHSVKNNPTGWTAGDPASAVARRKHRGAPGAPGYGELETLVKEAARLVSAEQKRCHGCISRLLGAKYPELSPR